MYVLKTSIRHFTVVDFKLSFLSLRHYRTKSKYSIYFNTSLRSPVPFALLEAMASGMIVVSTSTCEIPTQTI